MALSAHALTTYATVRTELGYTSADDATIQTRLERYIEAASAEIEILAGGRRFDRGIGLIERYGGYGTFRLILERTPIISISAIALLNADLTVASTYDSSSYAIEEADVGFVRRTSGWPWTAQAGYGISIDAAPLAGTEDKLIRVTYTGGWVTPENATVLSLTRTLPYDLEEACILGAVAMFHAGGKNRLIASETSAGGSSVSYVNANTIIGEGASILPQEAQRIARRYRRDWAM